MKPTVLLNIKIGLKCESVSLKNWDRPFQIPKSTHLALYFVITADWAFHFKSNVFKTQQNELTLPAEYSTCTWIAASRLQPLLSLSFCTSILESSFNKHIIGRCYFDILPFLLLLHLGQSFTLNSVSFFIA